MHKLESLCYRLHAQTRKLVLQVILLARTYQDTVLGRAELFAAVPQAKPLFFEVFPGGTFPHTKKKVSGRNPTFTRRRDTTTGEELYISVSVEIFHIFGVKIFRVHSEPLTNCLFLVNFLIESQDFVYICT